MKKYLSLLIAILFTLSLNAGGGKAKIVFDSTRYDFGYIQEDKGKVTHSFKFTNDGDAHGIAFHQRACRPCRYGFDRRNFRPRRASRDLPKRGQSLYQCQKSIHKIDYRRDCCT